MLYSTTSGQGVLPLATPVCKRCPYRLRCAGPNGGSVLSPPASIGCLDTKRQNEVYENLRWTHPYKLTEVLAPPRLPCFIPQIIEGAPEGSELPSEEIWAVSLSTLLDKHGRLRFRDADLLRESLKLPQAARLLLSGLALDKRLEKFWTRSEEDEYWPLIQKLRFSAATSFTFSVWGNDPRFDQLYNQDRNQVTFHILNSLGIPTIPFFFCAAPEDYTRAANWLQARPSITVVGVLASYCQTRDDLERLLIDAQHLARLVGRPYRHMVVGVATRDKIDCACDLLDDPIIVTAQPVVKAIRDGAEANERLEFVKVQGGLPRDLIRRNLARFRAHLN